MNSERFISIIGRSNLKIGPYTFEEFKALAAKFHGYPAPGLLIGGYMVGAARARLPEGTLFEAFVETRKCLPDAVQLLTPCTTGNNWMHIVNLGRYALSLYDKYTGEGVRVSIDCGRLKDFPEIQGWFMKSVPKADQDSTRLLEEIEEAADSIFTIREVRIRADYLDRHAMKRIGTCPVCHEAYPEADGAICRGCQGEEPYLPAVNEPERHSPPLVSVPVSRAVGRKALHDMTEIIPGISKKAAVSAGHTITGGDVCRLQRMGRNHVYVEEDPGREWVHENEAVKILAERIAGPGIVYRLPPKEGKIEFLAEHEGLLDVNVEKLVRFNLCPDVMLATRHNNSVVEEGRGVGGCRTIPLYISRELFSRAIGALGDGHLLSVLRMRKVRAGVLITGSEVFQGLIEDRFLPIVVAKLERFGGTVVDSVVAPDDAKVIGDGINRLISQQVDLLITTGGMSVDPEDVTRQALLDLGVQGALYGMPVLPGTMTLTGRLGDVQVIGLPACALYHKVTGFDLLLPRLLAGKEITRKGLALMSEGGFCLGCQSCTFPKCPYGS